jgi:hypothetical protein
MGEGESSGLLRDMRLTGVLVGIRTIHPEATMIETNKVSVPSHARVLASQKPLVRRDVSASWLLRQVGAKMKLVTAAAWMWRRTSESWGFECSCVCI